jgi:TolB-like protein
MRRAIAIGVSLLALVCLAAEPPKSAARAAKPTVAIVYFDYDGTDELAVLKKGLAQMLITDLLGHPTVKLVERARMQEIFDELKLTESKKVDPATAVKIGRLLGAQYVLYGGYYTLYGKLVISARVVSAELGESIISVRVAGAPDAFFEIETELAQKLYGELATKVPPTQSAEKESAAARPKKPAKATTKVALGYSRALEALDKKDKVTARKELDAVLKEQPDFVLASLDLADLVK